MYRFTVITAVYNRAHLLRNLYQSLVKQSITDIEWIIVDDGSKDNCKEVVESFELLFPIRYLFQENAGKHVALNLGINKANSIFTVIIDSDDELYGSSALETVWNIYNEIDFKKFNCASVSGLNIDKKFKIIGQSFPVGNPFVISDHIRMRHNNKITGDKCEFFLTEVIKKYDFPVFSGEKFLTESIVWNRIALKYNTIYTNTCLKLVEYLLDGLSSNNELLFSKSVNGYLLFFNEASLKPFNVKLRLLHASNYIRVAKLLGYSYIKIIRDSKNKFIMLPALLLAFIRTNKPII